jgi:hypothetical protein
MMRDALGVHPRQKILPFNLSPADSGQSGMVLPIALPAEPVADRVDAAGVGDESHR